MNISTNSECSSGCESGWTMYWDQLSNSTTDFSQRKLGAQVNEYGEQQDQEEDLSMVSDASSAPPNSREIYRYASQVSEDKKKSKEKIMCKTKEARHSFCLDDTATSSIFHISQDNVAHHPSSVEHVPGLISLQEEPKPKKHLGFFKSSTKGKSGSFLGRKKK